MTTPEEYKEFEESYGHHRTDIRFVVIVNLFLLGALVGLYFLNREYGFLDALLRKF